MFNGCILNFLKLILEIYLEQLIDVKSQHINHDITLVLIAFKIFNFIFLFKHSWDKVVFYFLTKNIICDFNFSNFLYL